MEFLTVAAVNVNGLRDKQSRLKAAAICNQLSASRRDVTCLLDTRLDPLTEAHITQYWPKATVFAHNAQARTNGIALLFHTDKVKRKRVISDPHGRYVLVDAEVNGQPLLLIPVYAPSSDPTQRRLFFRHLHRQIDLVITSRHNVILLGDFNVTECDVMDRLAGTASNDPSLPHLQHLLTDHSLEDFWRKSHPHERAYTFRGHQGARSRLDRVYTSRQYRNLLVKSDIIPFVHSDHDMVEVAIRTAAVLQGNGLWALDPDILQEDEYRSLITSLLRHWAAKKDQFPSLLAWWDALKLRIKNVSRSYARARAASRHRHHQSLVKRLRQLTRRPDPTPRMRQFEDTLRARLQQLELESAKRAILQAKSQWVEEGERCSSYFLRLQAKRKQDTTMHAVRVSPTETAVTSDAILTATEGYYRRLYTASPVSENLQNVFLARLTTSLTPADALSCEGAFTLAELKNAVYNSNRHKSPGSDGLPLEFYLTFFPDLQADFLLMANSLPELGTLTATQRNAVITCIPKDGDLTSLANWRPISVLNADYKILSKIIAERVAKVLPQLIHHDQTCNIPSRKIQYNLSLIRDVIAYGTNATQSLCVLTVDQMKAFDKVSWSFLRKILTRFAFGPQVIRWIDLLYRDITSQMKVNGYVSPPFPLRQGVRQGCPLSPLLYALYAEVLAESIRQDVKIVGIDIAGAACKVSQYADDTTLFLSGDASLYALADLLAAYQTATGAVVNPAKCCGLWLGANRGRSDSPLGYTWSSSQIKILGLYFGTRAAVNHNFEVAAEKFRKTLQLWSARDLSMKGKRIVINQLAHSKLVYPSHVFVCPPHLASSLQTAALRFFHSNKRIVVAPELLYLPVPLGGMGLLDINRRLRATRLSWVARLYDTKCKGKWRETMSYFLGLYRRLQLGRHVFKTFLSCHRQTLLPLPPFYRALIDDWATFAQMRRLPPSSLGFIYQEPIFYNPFLTAAPRPAALPRPHRPPYWYFRSLPGSFRTLGDVCYQYQAGFHRAAELVELTGCPGVTRFVQTLIHSLPPAWLQAILHDSSPIRQQDDISVKVVDVYSRAITRDVSGLTSSDFYSLSPPRTFLQIQTEHDLDDRVIYTTWERRLGQINWKKTFLYMYRNHMDKRVTDVQYKHIHGKIAPRLTLFRAGLQASCLCPRCHTEPEELLHIFLDCPLSKRMWTTATRHLALVTGRDPTFFLPHRFIVVGFADSPLPPPSIQAAEDIRMAFFSAIWTSRNRALWDQVLVPPEPLYTQHLTRTLGHRYRLARLSRQEEPMLQAYGHPNLFSISHGSVDVRLLDAPQ